MSDAACEAFFREFLRLRPLSGTSLGLKEHDGEVEDLSPAGVRRQIAFFKRWERELSKLAAAEPSSVDAARLAQLARFCMHLLERGEHPASLELVFDLYETLCVQELRAQTPAEWSALVSRLTKLPGFLAQVRSNLMKSRRTLDRRYLQDAAGAFRSMADDLEAMPHRARRAALKPASRNAAGILRAFSKFVEARLLPKATEGFALGRAEYAWRLKHGLGISLTPEQVAATGRRLLSRIHARMETLAREIEPSARGKAGLKRVMDKLSASAPRDDREMFAVYRGLAARARRFVARKRLFEISPGYALKIIPTPAGLGASVTTAAYFVAPPLDPSKKGYFLVTPSRGDKKRLLAHNRYHAASTAVHEAFPGHDMQFFLWQKMRARIPAWRHLHGDPKDWATAMNVEGYAHYAEELMRGHGFYTPREELFQLAAQAWRAARLVVDAGLHAGGLSIEAGAKILERGAFLDPKTAAGESFRYSKWPTQALTYALGKLEIEALKDDCREAWGARFTEARFHDVFLSYGPLPPALIRRALLGIE